MVGIRTLTRTGLLIVPVLVLALAGCTGSSSSSVPDAPGGPVPEELSAALTAVLDEAIGVAGATGAVAGVWSPWAGGWEAAIGSESDERTTPLTTQAHVRLGTGGTEAMTCDVVAGLADEGRLDLDADIGLALRSLPGRRAHAPPALLAHLRSGRLPLGAVARRGAEPHPSVADARAALGRAGACRVG